MDAGEGFRKGAPLFTLGKLGQLLPLPKLSRPFPLRSLTGLQDAPQLPGGFLSRPRDGSIRRVGAHKTLLLAEFAHLIPIGSTVRIETLGHQALVRALLLLLKAGLQEPSLSPIKGILRSLPVEWSTTVLKIPTEGVGAARTNRLPRREHRRKVGGLPIGLLHLPQQPLRNVPLSRTQNTLLI